MYKMDLFNRNKIFCFNLYCVTIFKELANITHIVELSCFASILMFLLMCHCVCSDSFPFFLTLVTYICPLLVSLS